MKRAYVKPMFVAEEYEMTECVASCGKGSINQPAIITKGVRLCSGNGQDHTFKKDSDLQAVYGWSEAQKDKTSAYLFTNSNIECDFLWYGGDSDVQAWSTNKDDINSIVWKQEDREKLTADKNYSFGKKFMEFFFGIGADNENHKPGYNGYEFFS